MRKTSVLEGSVGVAEAVKACRPKVISAYPISPQTHVVETLAKMVAEGEIDADYVRVESEFSAASVVYGASAAGVRAYTASSSQGLLLMTEVIYNMAGTRLPVVVTGINRTVSSPITIQPDHQDTMAFRDAGIIQLYVESNQEAYATHIQAFKIAEDHEVLLPVMVCMDGWILTHCYEPLELLAPKEVDGFLPPYRPLYPLDPQNPVTYGSFADEEVMEFRYMVHAAMEKARAKIVEVAEEYRQQFGYYFGGLIEEYYSQDAEIILVAMGSVVATLKDAVDSLHNEGISIGLLKVRAYRPFPAAEVRKALAKAKVVAVLDKSLSCGHAGPLALDIKAAMYNAETHPIILSLIAGLGGREVDLQTVREIVNRCRAAARATDCDFFQLRSELV